MSSVLPHNEFVADGIYGLLEKRLISGYYLPGQKLPSVRELAKEYQISVGTVSGALKRLRDKGVVTLRQGSGSYVSSFRDQQKNRLKMGLLYFTRSEGGLSLEESPFGYSVFEGARHFCMESGYSLAVRPVFSDAVKVKKIIDDIKSGGEINGVILMYGGEDEFREYIHWFSDASIPVVLIDNPWRKQHKYSFIAGDDLQIGIRGADYLYGLGHRNILYVFTDHARCYREQLLGFKTAMMRHEVELPDNNILKLRENPEIKQVIEEMVSRILSDQGEERITAVCCGHDSYALELIERFREEDIKVPEDISVIGATGSNVGSHYHPALTTVTCGLEAMGARACEILIKLIDDPKSGPYQEVRDAHVVERESTSALSVQNSTI